MKRILVQAISLLALHACAAQTARVSQPSTLLRIGTVDSLTLCQGMTRHVPVGATWTGSTRLDSGLPEITWLSPDPGVARVDSTGAITGVAPGRVHLIVHGRLGREYGRATLPVTVLPGEWDEAAWLETRQTACRPR